MYQHIFIVLKSVIIFVSRYQNGPIRSSLNNVFFNKYRFSNILKCISAKNVVKDYYAMVSESWPLEAIQMLRHLRALIVSKRLAITARFIFLIVFYYPRATPSISRSFQVKRILSYYVLGLNCPTFLKYV